MIVLTIKRTSGEIEKVERKDGMNEVLFAKIQKATKDAGRGDVLSWEQVDDRTAAEKASHALSEKIEKTRISLARAREYSTQRACELRDELETLNAQRGKS